jgi:4a-hydroxytetrahydrobiopterin dehydratase
MKHDVLQVPGWQLGTDQQGTVCLRQEWKVKNFMAGLELFKRIGEVAEQEGHHPNLHLEGYNRVHVELNTHSVGKPPLCP